MAKPTHDEVARDLRMFGRVLCAAYERIGLDQPAFVKLTKYDRSTISKIECGKQAPKFETLLRLAQVAQVMPAELFDGIAVVESPPQPPNSDELTPGTAAERFGANLSWARDLAGFSHEKLGENAGADHSLISDWEKGECPPNLRTILKLARALEIPPALLLHGVSSDVELGLDFARGDGID